MQYFPLFVDTKKLNVLVVGAGEVAARKLALLERTEANITVVAETACEEALALASNKRITLKTKAIEVSDLDGVQILYMATSDNGVNQEYAKIAKQRNIWVNVVDNPLDCTFITPAIIDRGKLQIAISSSGAAPVIAGLIRTKIESWLPQSIAKLIDFSSKSRKLLKQKLPSDISFRQFWYRFFKQNGFGYQENTLILFNELLSKIESDFLASELKQTYFINSDSDISQLPISVLPILQQIDTVIYEGEIPTELNELIRRDANRVKVTSNCLKDREITESGLTLLIAKKHHWSDVIELSR